MAPIYNIERRAAQLFPSEADPNRTKVSLIITWTLWALYMFLQTALAWSFQSDSDIILWQMWTAVLAELCLSFQELVHALNLILTLFGVPNRPPRPSLYLVGDLAPTVAVLITCCGEPIDNVVNTVSAATTQDYPSERLSIFVLDDGADETLRQAIEALDRKSAKRGWAPVTYLSRRLKAGMKSYFKAGNLQFGIEETKCHGNSDLVAGLDADMIPQKDWLRKMVPHLLVDEGTALAIPPQVRKTRDILPKEIANGIFRTTTT